MSKMNPLRRVARLLYGDALASEVRQPGEVPVVGSGGISGFHNKANTPGPAIIVGRKGSYGSIFWEPRNCFVIDTAYSVHPVNSETDMRWLYYALQAVDLRGVSQDVGVPGLSREAAYSVSIPVSLPAEQRRIADFLDIETARIDQLALLRSRQVDTLSRALQSEAARVTGPDWQRVALRRVVHTVQTGTTPTEILRPQNPDNIPWYTPAALGGALDLNEADKSVRKEDVRRVPRFSPESILIVGIGESLGKVAILHHAATGNQQLTAIQTSDSVDCRFVAWRLFAAYEEIRTWAQYSRVRILNNEVLKSFVIPIPTLVQQVEVRKELDRRLAHFIDFRDAAARFSLIASERKQALITAAVTGQIDVTTAGGVAV